MASSPETRPDPSRRCGPGPSTDTSPKGTADAGQLTVANRPDDRRYELHLNGERVGLADYSLRDDVMTIPHVETERVHRGKSFAARLMAGVLDDVRSRNLTVRPLCPYADAYMRRNPDTEDLRAS
jgi:predicted GNAT family acetyltransferase